MEGTIFISYARHDSDFVRELAYDLRSAGADIWVDVFDISPGDTWDRAVEEALRGCESLLVVLSPAAVASRAVMDEVSFALDEGKRVLPILHRPCEIPFRLRRFQRIDFTADYAPALSKFLEALGAGTAEAEHESEPPRKNRSDNPEFDVPERSPKGKGANQFKGELKSRLPTALTIGIAGAVLSWVLLIMIFANDPRGPSQWITRYTAFAGFWWAVAGLISGPRRTPLLATCTTALAVLVGWILVFGTKEDVMGMAVAVGASFGAVLGAIIGVKYGVGRKSASAE